MIVHTPRTYGRSSTNRLHLTNERGIEGARALLESFYYAFNHRDMDAFRKIWAEHDSIQLNNPLGGMLRGYEPIAALYQRIFTGPAAVWVELADIVEFQTGEMVVFAGRETGEFSLGAKSLGLSIRTSRIIQWFGPGVGWRQSHHHGSIDDPRLLSEYQQAVRGA
ncbi:MAG: nuclear transport factor 2 family protein [Elusimicrobiota bacterium]|nr:nuclear transport factor 2 family protein [Elusimicrobiota bacterium]